jgi:hypothetical protein
MSLSLKQVCEGLQRLRGGEGLLSQLMSTIIADAEQMMVDDRLMADRLPRQKSAGTGVGGTAQRPSGDQPEAEQNSCSTTVTEALITSQRERKPAVGFNLWADQEPAHR